MASSRAEARRPAKSFKIRVSGFKQRTPANERLTADVHGAERHHLVALRGLAEDGGGGLEDAHKQLVVEAREHLGVGFAGEDVVAVDVAGGVNLRLDHDRAPDPGS